MQCKEEERKEGREGVVLDRHSKKKLDTWFVTSRLSLSTLGCVRVGRSILRTWYCLKGYWYFTIQTSER